jgi:hypothetical protein
MSSDCRCIRATQLDKENGRPLKQACHFGRPKSWHPVPCYSPCYSADAAATITSRRNCKGVSPTASARRPVAALLPSRGVAPSGGMSDGACFSDHPSFSDRRTCATGQSVLASITRTREPSFCSMRVCEQNSSLIADTRRSVVGNHCKVATVSPGQIRHLEPSSSSTM